MRAVGLSLVCGLALLVVGCLSGGGDNPGGGFGGSGGTGGLGGGGGTGGSTVGPICAEAATKLRSCSLLSPGVFAGCDEPTSAPNLCEADCLLNAPCAEVSAFFCDDTVVGGVLTCLTSCAQAHRFDCGDGTSVPGGFRCDGDLDCTNGADEGNCGDLLYTCSNGDMIRADWECDGVPDCSDFSDEVSCPMFDCASGDQSVFALWRCDGQTDCSDGSDEAGCPQLAQFTCN